MMVVYSQRVSRIGLFYVCNDPRLAFLDTLVVHSEGCIVSEDMIIAQSS